jgi:hypothetical protein
MQGGRESQPLVGHEIQQQDVVGGWWKEDGGMQLGQPQTVPIAAIWYCTVLYCGELVGTPLG